jgi:D-tagatose-1,6-bisphosphate aldolase subunit GatZ/KbaZ
MVKNPVYWKHYYHGSEKDLQFARKYSLSDRSRYYWAEPKVQQSLEHLFSNLEYVGLPLPLVSQFFPQQYQKIREGTLENTPKTLVTDRIRDVLNMYSYAITPGEE